MVGFASGRASKAICDRCNFKFDYFELMADGNSPSLRVCKNCLDPKNPWRFPPIQPDAISLKYPRPDTDISTSGNLSYPDLTNPNFPNSGEGDYPTK